MFEKIRAWIRRVWRRKFPECPNHPSFGGRNVEDSWIRPRRGVCEGESHSYRAFGNMRRKHGDSRARIDVRFIFSTCPVSTISGETYVAKRLETTASSLLSQSTNIKLPAICWPNPKPTQPMSAGASMLKKSSASSGLVVEFMGMENARQMPNEETYACVDCPRTSEKTLH